MKNNNPARLGKLTVKEWNRAYTKGGVDFAQVLTKVFSDPEHRETIEMIQLAKTAFIKTNRHGS